MESWSEEENLVLSSNQSLWVHLMNQSTYEWSLGPFPSNVFAINSTYNATYAARFPDGALVIENAGVAKIGNTAVEALVFGLVSAGAIAWAFWWLWKEYKTGDWKPPAPRDNRRPGRNGNGTEAQGIPLSTIRDGGSDDDDSQLLSPTAKEFKTALLSKYYERGTSELEVLDQIPSANRNDPERASVTPEKIEGVQEVLRKLYEFELEIAGQSNAHHPDNLHHLRERRDAALEAIRTIVYGWLADENGHGWGDSELGHVKAIKRALDAVTRRNG
ncbi:hypothetical protein E8E14_009279 [Neopestalotiopsis sp. 37M]|nr:hypothetical protein E8E14_009279 [Neopestalotiopsis sp. 37M]